MITSLVLAVLLIANVLGGLLAQGPPPPPRGDEAVRVAVLRYVGLARDSSKVDVLIAELKKPGHIDASYAAIRSLAQLGAQKGIDAINEIASKNRNNELANFAVVARARIRADAASGNIADPVARALVKLDIFLKDLAMDANLLNTRAKEDAKHLKVIIDAETRTGLFALREIADMIYRNSDGALLTVANARNLDFSIDSGSQLKIFLAPLSPSARLTWLINELANKTVMRAQDDFIVQLAVDFGLAASRAAAGRLSEMRVANRQQVHYMGFAALFSVLKGVGDKDQTAVMQQFLADQDDKVRHYAKQVYPDVASGTPWQTKITY